MAKGAYIAGKWAAGDGDWFEKTCPATGDTSWEGQAASAAQAALLYLFAHRHSR